MSYVFVWLGLLLGVFIYRYATGGLTPVVEHAAGMYFAAIALFVHWICRKFKRPRRVVGS